MSQVDENKNQKEKAKGEYLPCPLYGNGLSTFEIRRKVTQGKKRSLSSI